jgi:hypothetical protein
MRRALAAAVACGALTGCGGEPPDTSRTPRLVVTEERDGLWARDSAGDPRRLTALRVGGFHYDSLAALQREGEVILYWAAAPAISPDGRLLAYATNREAVAAGERGQSIWLLDLASGSERALLYRRAHSYRPVGWFDDDVVYIGDEPGVWTVDVQSGATRQLAAAMELAVADDGSAIAIAHGVPDSVRVSVRTRIEHLDVPAPPAGFEWLAQGSFSADARTLRLEAAADSGRTRRRFAFDLDDRTLRPIDP